MKLICYFKFKKKYLYKKYLYNIQVMLEKI